MPARPAVADAEALKRELDARFRGPLMSYFYRHVGERTEAEDLTQEVFVRLISASSLEGIENVNAFVFTIAANLLRDRHRHAHRWQMRKLPAIDWEMVNEVARDFVEDRGPERVFIAKETLSSVMASLGELDERTRNIFVLSRLENMKQREIAALYGISQSTVEKHVMKAVMHLALRHSSETTNKPSRSQDDR